MRVYPRLKFGRRYVQERAQAEQDTNGASRFEFPVEARQWALMAASQPATRAGSAVTLGLDHLQSWRTVVARLYPWIHASYESAVLVQQVLYLFGKTKCCSPRLWLLGLELRRALMGDTQRLQELLEKTRTAQLAWAASFAMPLKQVLKLVLRCWHLINDNAKVRVPCVPTAPMKATTGRDF